MHSAAHGFARDRCRTAATAEDIAQEALVRFLRRSNDVRDPYSWLFVVTRRIAQRARRLDLSRSQVEAGLEHVTPSDFLGDGVRALRNLLHHPMLSIRDRRVLAWVIVGYTQSEIAQRLGCSRGHVAQYVARARRRLSA